MARRSNKSIAEILTPSPSSSVATAAATYASSLSRNNDTDDLLLLERKITLAVGQE